ncbi:histidine phosphatase family protein [Steroidobacter cummioxidans]|uniref:histidine phosphatase family protein n=1 Tax=Steroidobacter cummioxidans TaxID=1803913 RepID=UPI000E310E70|nr:histidine phosphatase family protein [Steroidobacter cummioxidans]
MPRLYLVRHARPAASWGEDPDPGLDATGLTQAQATAEELARSLSRLPLYSSPMRRCRETAQPLAQIWFCNVELMPAVAEIPSPPIPFSARRDWLIAAMRGTWQQLHENAPAGSIDYLQWRRDLLESLLAIKHDCVIYSHFIAINAAVGAAQKTDDVVCFRPDHAAVTVVSNDRKRLRVVELGRQADTLVLARQ